MTDTITPASLRAHADHMERVHLDGISAEEMRQEAARLEAEAAREEDQAYHNARVLELANVIAKSEQNCELNELDPWRWEQVRSAARSVYEIALWLIEEARWTERVVFGEWPTDPAESARDEEAERLAEDLAFAYCLGFGHDADEFKWNPGGRGHDAWLAVARQVLVLAADGRLLPECGTDLLPCDRCNGSGSEPAVSVPGSGPDGTPEKPWPTWQEVPEGVKYRGRSGCIYVNRNGVRYAVHPKGYESQSDSGEGYIKRIAPFVRVDGDK